MWRFAPSRGLAAFLCVPCTVVGLACHAGAKRPSQAELQAHTAHVQNVLVANLGKPFPDLRLQRTDDAEVERLADYLGLDMAVLYAGGAINFTRQWVDELKATNWEVEGRPVRLVLAQWRDPDLAALVHPVPMMVTDWPLPGYLRDNNLYPILYFIDAHGHYAGFMWRGSQPIWVKGEEESP